MKKAIRFTAEWCKPCGYFAPTYNKVGDEFPDIDKIIVDVGNTEGSETAQKYGILGIPAVVFINDDQIVSTMAGNQPTEEVRKSFQKLQDA